ncbi:MAG: hypothetical protein IT496_11120 [Gammaproteobacteria bacterium]|nr:hypothetical protein [Gammaproteobacteria bacterium]
MEAQTSTNNDSATTTTPETREVRLSGWVNEPLLDIRQILSGREISRLTRRPRWLLLGLAALGRFPKRRTHCGKPVGWHRADVLDWLTQRMAVEPDCPPVAQTCRQSRPRQVCLPFEISARCAVRGDVIRRRAHGETT